MSSLALGLVLLAALLHAGWNFLAKSSQDTIAYFWWLAALGATGYGLWLLLAEGITLSPGSVVPFAISAAAETGYFYTLMKGYARGDLSLVYPLSRGAAPLFLTLWNAILFHEFLPPLGLLGVLAMAAGVSVASLSENGGRAWLSPGSLVAPFRDRAARWALASALFISIYSLSDKYAIAGGTPPLIYNWWVYAGNAVLWTPLVWSRKRSRGNWVELRRNGPRILLGAVMTVGAYLAVLQALAMANPSYVIAGRGLSVIVASLLGAMLLNERVGRTRFLGAALMVGGLALVSLV